MKFYIAFSIHGTNTFLVATKEAKDIKALGNEFRAAASRRPNLTIEKDGQKITWNGLMTKSGEPHKSHIYVLGKFYELGRMGWEINQESLNKFKTKHFSKKHEKKPDSVPRRFFGH